MICRCKSFPQSASISKCWLNRVHQGWCDEYIHNL